MNYMIQIHEFPWHGSMSTEWMDLEIERPGVVFSERRHPVATWPTWPQVLTDFVDAYDVLREMEEEKETGGRMVGLVGGLSG